MLSHVYTVVAGLLPTITALFAYLKAREASKKSDIIIVQTNGTVTRLLHRNAQLASELSSNDISIPPPIVNPTEEKRNEGHS